MDDDDDRVSLATEAPPPSEVLEPPVSPTDGLLPIRTAFKLQEEQPSSVEEQPTFPRDDEAIGHHGNDAEPTRYVSLPKL